MSRRSLSLVCLLALATATSAFAGGSPLHGTWVLEELRDGVVTSGIRSTLEVRTDGRAIGSAGCNGYGGNVTVNDEALQFTDIAWTELACEPAIMAQEKSFLAVLAAAVEFHAEAGVLVLIDSAGSKLATLRSL
jgi:putative lipoprotein